MSQHISVDVAGEGQPRGVFESHRETKGVHDDGENDDCVWVQRGEGPGGRAGAAAASETCAGRGGSGTPVGKDALQYASAVHFLVEVSSGRANRTIAGDHSKGPSYRGLRFFSI